MNKREKELVELLYDDEQAVLKEIEKQYKKTLDEINLKIRILQSDELTQSKVYQLQYQQALKKQIEGLVEKLHGDEYTTIQQYLHDSYTNSFVGTMYNMAGQGIPLILPIDQKAAVKAILTDSKINGSLYDALGVDTNNLKKKIRQEITRGIAGGMTYNDIARNITATTRTPLSNARRIVQTEGHRIQQASTFDAQQASKAKGADVVKQWDSTLDGDTRPTHRKLDGQIREVDKPFEEDGKEAMFPGDFGDPAEDCNCRCVSLTRARWALDEDELQTLKDRAAFFELDKTKDFEEFKEKYLGAVDKMAAGAQSENDWSKAVPRDVSKEEKEELIQYAKDNGINLINLKHFDGDPNLLKSNVDTISQMNSDFPLGKKITISVSNSLPDDEFANLQKSTITYNSKALRNRSITEQNIASGGMFASETVEDISVHEYGHLIADTKGNVGLEIAMKTYYNVFGNEASVEEVVEYLGTNISEYSTHYSNEQGAQKFNPKRYKEIISEVLAKNNSEPDSFTKEFVLLLKEMWN